MQYNKVEISGINTSELELLSEQETKELLIRTKEGDMQARERLILGNLRLVLSVLQKFIGRGESADDLFQVGVIGLIKAVDNFNVDLNVKFSTYGVPTKNSGRNFTPLKCVDDFYVLVCKNYPVDTDSYSFLPLRQ